MNPPRWILSAHAADVLPERDIDSEWIARVLREPLPVEADKAGASLYHALAPIAERDGRILRVVYRWSVDPCLVVTAFFDRVETRKLRQ